MSVHSLVSSIGNPPYHLLGMNYVITLWAATSIGSSGTVALRFEDWKGTGKWRNNQVPSSCNAKLAQNVSGRQEARGNGDEMRKQ